MNGCLVSELAKLVELSPETTLLVHSRQRDRITYP